MMGGANPAAFAWCGGGSCGSRSANICSMFRRVVGVRVGVVRVGAPALLPPPWPQLMEELTGMRSGGPGRTPPPASSPNLKESRDILSPCDHFFPENM